MQTEKAADQAEQGNETKTIPVKRKRKPKNTTNKRPKATGSPSNALDPASVLGIANSFNHDGVQHNVAASKKKRRKRAKKDKSRNTTAVKPKNTPKKTTTRKPKSNLKPAVQETPNPVANHAVNSFDAPRERNDSTVKSKISGAGVVGLDEVVPEDIAGRYDDQPKEKVDKKDIAVGSTNQCQIAWEHFALLVEEYLLAKDVRM
tara:strand:- start:201 stop:812 length:612 start_codon:yes stop_codon:yes gene_type:complete